MWIATQLTLIVLLILGWWPETVLGHDEPNNSFFRSETTSADVTHEGTLICFRCDIDPSPAGRARCEQEGHAPLFKKADGHIHRLTGSRNSITTKLASDTLHGKKVKIKGIYHAETNHVLVEEVIPLEQ